MTAESDQLFTSMLQEAGVPVTEAEMQSRWDQINTEQGSQIQNDSQWSPFWRLISAIVTEPCKWLVQLLVSVALPNIFLKYATGKWLDLYAWSVDVERKPALPLQGVIRFTRSTSAGEIFIPLGTVVESPSINGYVYRLRTTADVTLQDGLLSGNVPVEAELAGSAWNLGPGYYSILPVPVSGIVSVTNEPDWITRPGADEEQDEELRLRGRNQFSAVGQYHHDAAYTADIAGFAGIRTDYLFFEHGAPRGPGSANCYVMIDSGVPAQELLDQINAYVRDKGNHGHGDDMLCFPVPTLDVSLSVSVHPLPHSTEVQREDLRDAVENMVRAAFRENASFPTVTQTWPCCRFSFSRLSDELHGQFPNLQSVEFDRDDIVSGMELPVLQSLLVVLKGKSDVSHLTEDA